MAILTGPFLLPSLDVNYNFYFGRSYRIRASRALSSRTQTTRKTRENDFSTIPFYPPSLYRASRANQAQFDLINPRFLILAPKADLLLRLPGVISREEIVVGSRPVDNPVRNETEDSPFLFLARLL